VSEGGRQAVKLTSGRVHLACETNPMSSSRVWISTAAVGCLWSTTPAAGRRDAESRAGSE
jgi:hypothetical protein